MEKKTTKTTMKDHLNIDISPNPPLPDARDSPIPQRIPFFFGRRSESTWVVSLFVVIQLVAFLATMFVNNCPERSNGDCILRSFGRFSFQPLSENPLLGPSSSTLVKMGAFQQKLVIQQHQEWRLVTCPWLHAGVIHLIVNLSSIILVGIRLEQDFGPLRTGMIYLLSAFLGSLASALLVQQVPVVGSSGALFGLLGATLSGLIRNWQIYANKFAALVALTFIAVTNFSVGFLPRADNFSNIGGFLSGILLGFALLYNPQLSQLEQKKGIFDYDVKGSLKLRQKLDKPASRIISLVFFSIIFAGGLITVLRGVSVSEHCGWCQYINCVPTKIWSCNGKATPCEAALSDGRLTLTCTDSDKFRTYPSPNFTQERMGDLCSQICS